MRRGALLIVVLALPATPAAAADPFTAIAGPGGPTMVGAKQGWRVWSERQRGAAEWRIVVRAPRHSIISRPPVPGRSVPFDIDAGVDGDGNVVATYSRCEQEPAPTGGANPFASGGLPQYVTGKGCTIWILDLLTGRERSLPHVLKHDSEVLPSIAGRRLAFVGTREGGDSARRATLAVRDVFTRRVERLSTGPRRRGSVTTAIGPTSVDTDGRTVAAAWRIRKDRSFRSRILVRRIAAKRTTVAATAVDRPGEPFAALLAPTVDGTEVSFLSTFGDGLCERRFTRRGKRPAYGVQRSTAAASPVAAALDGDTLVVAESHAADSAPTRPTSAGQIVEYEQRRYRSRAAAGERCA